MRIIGGDGVNGAIMRPHLSHQIARVRRPKFYRSRSASRHHDVATRQICQPTDPVFVSVVKGLDQLLVLEVPLFDACVTGSRPKCVTIDGHALDTIVMGWVEVHLGCDDPTLVLWHLEHLDVVVLASGDDVVGVHGSVAWTDCQAHNGCLMTTRQFSDRVELSEIPETDLFQS